MRVTSQIVIWRQKSAISGTAALAKCQKFDVGQFNQKAILYPAKVDRAISPRVPTLIQSLSASPTFPNRRQTREWQTVNVMIEIYCRDQHGAGPCSACEELRNYVKLRLERCRFGEEKPTCARCPVHCYQRERRDQIKTVMRYSGPRMVWAHPWLSLRHLLDGWISSGKLPAGRVA
jgi:hypothetical protein